MNDHEVLQRIRIVRGLRLGDALPQEVETPLEEFVRFVDQYGLSATRIADLAVAIAESGTRLSHKVPRPLVNVHSTGAPGSLSTLLSPVLVAATGFYVPQVSVSGGVAGAIDSLATIPGYDDGLSPTRLKSVLQKSRLVQVGHTTADYAYADRVLWCVRNSTGTKKVPSLISASLLGKMLSVGARHGVVDVRVGPAGNAGATIEAAVDAAYTIVDAAHALDMRVTCVLSDATRLQWKKVGRLEAVLSLWEILNEPGRFECDPHVDLCIVIAAAACHAASPSIGLKKWRVRVKEALTNGRAHEVFIQSLMCHGASQDAMSSLIATSADRHRVQLDLTGKVYAPDLGKISGTIKSLRDKIGGPEKHQVGLIVDPSNEKAVAYIPEQYTDLQDYARSSFADALTENVAIEPIPTGILLFTGKILPEADDNISL